MNYRGSYRRLLGNGKAALLASIEIYNKPRVDYRDECFVILLLNAWELILKAVLSKNGQSIFYPKRRNEAHRTYSLDDALRKTQPLLPTSLGLKALKMNLALLSTYRDNAVHFYNAEGFGSVIYVLAQTAIVNLKDLLKLIFDVNLSEEITWQLLPLALDPPIDPLQYMAGNSGPATRNTAVQQFLSELAKSTQSLEAQHLDTGRLLTIFKVKLESTKKIENADLVVGLKSAGSADSPDGTGPLVITKSIDPNVTHPLRTSDVVSSIGTLHGKPFTSNTFQAIAWKHRLKENPQYCWKVADGNLIRYSHETLVYIRRLTSGDVDLSLQEYKQNNAKRAAKKSAGG